MDDSILVCSTLIATTIIIISHVCKEEEEHQVMFGGVRSVARLDGDKIRSIWHHWQWTTSHYAFSVQNVAFLRTYYKNLV